MVAFAGAGPCPQITSVRPRLVSWTMIGTSPPGPFRCGSTTCSVKAVATPASKALPPFSSVPMPTAVAIQCVEVTTPKVPSISGRVVNGLGLMLPAMRLVLSGRPYSTLIGGKKVPPVAPLLRFRSMMVEGGTRGTGGTAIASLLDRPRRHARSGQDVHYCSRRRPDAHLWRVARVDGPDRDLSAGQRRRRQRPRCAALQQFDRAHGGLFRRAGLWRDHLHGSCRDE